jgi:DNA-binding protein HU-beta
VNRKELVAEIAERAELEKKKSDEVLQHIVEIIMKSVAKGETIAIPGFAKFARVDRKARMGRNPATGETIKIKASRKAKITPLKAFKDAALTGKVAPSKVAAKKAVAKKAPAKKAVTKKAVAKKAPTKKAVTKKAVVKKAPAKKAPAKKAVAKKAVAKKR